MQRMADNALAIDHDSAEAKSLSTEVPLYSRPVRSERTLKLIEVGWVATDKSFSSRVKFG